MSKTQKIGKLSPSESAVARRVLLGKETIYKLDNIKDLDRPISELKPCGKSIIRKLLKNNTQN